MVLCFCVGFQSFVVAETVGIFFDNSVEQIKFAAGDVKTALVAKGFTVEELALSTISSAYANKKVIISLSSNSTITKLLTDQGGTIPTGLGEQAYALRTTTQGQTSFWVLGGDISGAMYGGLQIAENIKFDGFTQTYTSQESPTILKRGIKLNIPWDYASKTYGDPKGSGAMNAVANVWDSTFWKPWFDVMARNRYNTISVWSYSPFSSLVKVPEYPDCALQNVTGFDATGNAKLIKTMTIDEKIVFWKRIMAYAKTRGFDFLLFNWNSFVENCEGKYGLAKGSTSIANQNYNYKSMLKLLETYPDLDGFGITTGESFTTDDTQERERWMYESFAKPMVEYATAHPERKLRFIHRWWLTEMPLIQSSFGGAIKGPKNLTFDISYKYSFAHMYSSPAPGYWGAGDIKDLTGAGLKTWFTVRNDDIFYANWGDPEFVRAYINNMPGKGTYLQGFYMGPDGNTQTRSYFSKNSVSQGILEVERQWYMFMLWGRLSYNPATSDALLKNHLKYRYPAVNSDKLFVGWSKASRGIPKATELVQGEFSSDHHWWPEASWSDGDNGTPTPFVTAAVYGSVDVGDGSTLCNIANSAKNSCAGKKTSLQVATEMEADAADALSNINDMSAPQNSELGVAIMNVKSMGYLSMFYAWKIRGATYIKSSGTQNALKASALGKSYCWWMAYSNLMDLNYLGLSPQRVEPLPNWHTPDAAVLKDYTDNGGSGTPNCTDVVVVPVLSHPKSNLGFSSLSSKSVTFNLPKDGMFSLSIFTASGTKVVTINGARGKVGMNKIDMGTRLDPGVYFISLNADGISFVKKQSLIGK